MSAPEWHRAVSGGQDVFGTPTHVAVSNTVAALRDLGIEIIGPIGRVAVDPDTLYAEIGSLIIDHAGTIYVVPTEDATTEQIGEVVRQAKAARITGPVGAGWARDDELGHVCSVFEPPN